MGSHLDRGRIFETGLITIGLFKKAFVITITEQIYFLLISLAGLGQVRGPRRQTRVTHRRTIPHRWS